MAKYRRYYYWKWTNYYWKWRSGNWTNANKTGTKNIWNDGAKTWKKHEGATATVFTEDTLGY